MMPRCDKEEKVRKNLKKKMLHMCLNIMFDMGISFRQFPRPALLRVVLRGNGQ